MLALEYHRSVAKFLAARTLGERFPGLLAGPAAALRLVQRDDPVPPADGWARIRPILSGICGSDLATLSGHSSFSFSALVSMPFVPGHEVVGVLEDPCEDLAPGTRVVLDPVLGCAARGIEEPCEPCATGTHGLCERVTGGHVSAGLQTGYCQDTGGGWGRRLIAHRSQLHAVPEALNDEAAVLIEPLACALHAVRRVSIPRDAHVLVVGAGTQGLLTILALRAEGHDGTITCVAKHPQQASLARRLGATDATKPADALAAIRLQTRAFRLHPERSTPFLLGGVDIAFDSAGNHSSLDLALRATKARGTVIMSGMPARVDLMPAWFRELTVTGAYSGAGCFDDAITLAGSHPIADLVSAVYTLDHWRDALDHAFGAGGLGATKICFDPQQET